MTANNCSKRVKFGDIEANENNQRVFLLKLKKIEKKKNQVIWLTFQLLMYSETGR
jgi:hypothetical protein